MCEQLLGDLLFRKNEFDEAMTKFQKLLQDKPGHLLLHSEIYLSCISVIEIIHIIIRDIVLLLVGYWPPPYRAMASVLQMLF